MSSEKRQNTSSIFGEVLRRQRRLVDLSQAELAERAELHPTYISLLERGLRQPTLETLLALGSALDRSAAELVLEVEDVLQAGSGE